MAKESLLGQPGGAPEDSSRGDSREHHPDASWRADALGRSRHARLSEHVREPLDDRDPDKARRICAEVTRDLLGDLAPALVLVPAAERLRCQVLATWLQTLFDFARQSGVEGERLSALNRLEFTLEQSLDGEPVGQPVFVGMALEDNRREWPRQALDAMMVAARRRVVRPRLETPEEVAADAAELAGAIGLALGGQVPDTALVDLSAALIRLRALLGLGDAIRRDHAALPTSELPSRGDLRQSMDRAGLDAAVRAELVRLRPALEVRCAAAAAPPFRAGVRYLRLAGLALADRVAAVGPDVVSAPPRLGLATRLGLLVRARLGA